MTETSWHVAQDGRQAEGTLNPQQVAELVRSSPTSSFLVWKDGMGQWMAPSEVPEITALLAPSGPAESQKNTPPSSAKKHAPTGAGAFDLGAVKERMGFWRSLFDLKFESLVTPTMVTVLYAVAMIFVVLGFLAMLFSGLTSIVSGIRFGAWGMAALGVVWILLSPILAILYLAMIRLFFEVVVVLFKIHEELKRR
jgi:hypothetical protein